MDERFGMLFVPREQVTGYWKSPESPGGARQAASTSEGRANLHDSKTHSHPRPPPPPGRVTGSTRALAQVASWGPLSRSLPGQHWPHGASCSSRGCIGS